MFLESWHADRTRVPGVATGTFAVEVAMDELAEALSIDPLQLRLINYAEVDPHSGKPFTGKHLRECYRRAAERFGWSKRPPPRARCATASTWSVGEWRPRPIPAITCPRRPSSGSSRNGRVLVASGTQEIGNGIYTLMTQVASDVLRISPHLIDARLGDTSLPPAPLTAGSMTTASALRPAVIKPPPRPQAIAPAVADAGSPLYVQPTGSASTLEDLRVKSDPGRAESFVAVLNRQGNRPVEVVLPRCLGWTPKRARVICSEPSSRRSKSTPTWVTFASSGLLPSTMWAAS